MDEAVLARQDLDEGAVRLDPTHLARVDLPDLRLLRQPFDDLDRAQRRGLVGGSDRDLARVLDVDLATGLLDDRPDRLPARADDVADAVSGDLHREDSRRIWRNVRPRPVDRGRHLL